MRALLCRDDVDQKGEQLTGTHAYVLRFEPGHLPTVATFWNLAMYDTDNFSVDNQLGRYTIGSTTDGLQPDPDGSLTIAIQHQPPADTANWLPAPSATIGRKPMTSSSTATLSTPSPSASTVPETSMPGVWGSVTGNGPCR